MDDTMVFLSENDELSKVDEIKAKWCSAAGAKFNDTKTEIIPIGNKKYRDQMKKFRVLQTSKIKNRRDNNEQELIQNEQLTGPEPTELGTNKITSLPEGEIGESEETTTNGGESVPEEVMKIQQGVRIVADREVVCILGAWFGTNINQEAIWALTLEKIDKALSRWTQSSPTVEGRTHIIQMVVGGMTQYLTKVQGMPKGIQTRLDKRIHKFFWGERNRMPINKDTTQDKIEKGRKNLLDLEAHNEAIEIVWLKEYLEIEANRKLWARIADEIYATHITKKEMNIHKEARINHLQQSWRSKIGKGTKLPPELKRMTKTVEKYGVRMEGISFSRNALPS
ncbi:hypothetical protein PQX77_022298 [Marasmius sp. AFHP31]|nr:hypothetical protein PQX77_022298 [Marasmius sp. AFHP31]